MIDDADQQRRPTRRDFMTGIRLSFIVHMISSDRGRMHDAEADDSPADPSFTACSGDNGHPGSVAVGDMASVEAVTMVGEIGGAWWISCTEPAWLAAMDP